MKILTLFIVILSFNMAAAQDAQTEINKQVWQPFIQYFNDYNSEGFLSVHSKDVVRSPRDSKKIFGWDEYLKNQKAGDQRSMGAGRKRTLDLHFTERISGNDLAMDIGVYKTTSMDGSGQPRDFYGRFHVVLRKENGVWKILVDTDSSEGGTIGEKDFLAAKGIN